ncbi:MAG: hypothetical protein U0835_00340 [Isosphaeraceae bacterium]
MGISKEDIAVLAVGLPTLLIGLAVILYALFHAFRWLITHWEVL